MDSNEIEAIILTRMAGKQQAIAESLHMSDSAFSKFKNDELKRFAGLCAKLGLAFYPQEEVKSLEVFAAKYFESKRG